MVFFEETDHRKLLESIKNQFMKQTRITSVKIAPKTARKNEREENENREPAEFDFRAR